MPANLAPPTQDDRLSPAALGRQPTRFVAAPGAALAHAALLALVAWLSIVPRGPPLRIGSLSMVLTPAPGPASQRSLPAAPPPPEPPPPEAPPTPLPPSILAAPVAPPMPQLLALRAAPGRARSRPRGPSAAPSRPLPAADHARPDDATSAAAPSTPASPSTDAQLPAAAGPALAGLEAAIDQAIRDAAVMPEAARRQGRQGRVLARFSYLDGMVQDPTILRSSHSQLLDDAALRAVRQARCPATPAGLGGQRLDLVVWIDFRVSPS